MIKINITFLSIQTLHEHPGRTFLRHSAVPQTLRDEVVDELENQL